MKKLFTLLVLLIVILISGCTQEPIDQVSTLDFSLPAVTGWEMNEMGVVNPEGVEMLKGFYKQSGQETYVTLTIIKGDSENRVKNAVEALAYESLDSDPKKTVNGFAGDFTIAYLEGDNFHVIYATSGKTRFVAAAETEANLKNFLTNVYGNIEFFE